VLHVPVFEDHHQDDDSDIDLTSVHQLTASRAVFASLSRLRLAIELGFVLDPASENCQHRAGKYCADIETRVELHEQHHMPYTEDVSSGAAESGSVRKMQWLLDEQQCPQADNVDCTAVHAPTLDMLKWLKQRGCVFTAEPCTAAVLSHQAASVLHYLHSVGAPFDASTITAAIEFQKLQLLQWLCEHGCDLSEVHPLASRHAQDPQTLSWLHSNGCPCHYNYLFLQAAGYGFISTLKWVRDSGVTQWSAQLLMQCLAGAGVREQLDVAKVREFCSTPLTAAAAVPARYSQHVHVIEMCCMCCGCIVRTSFAVDQLYTPLHICCVLTRTNKHTHCRAVAESAGRRVA
jgi:hypothetical protein